MSLAEEFSMTSSSLNNMDIDCFTHMLSYLSTQELLCCASLVHTCWYDVIENNCAVWQDRWLSLPPHCNYTQDDSTNNNSNNSSNTIYDRLLSWSSKVNITRFHVQSSQWIIPLLSFIQNQQQQQQQQHHASLFSLHFALTNNNNILSTTEANMIKCLDNVNFLRADHCTYSLVSFMLSKMSNCSHFEWSCDSTAAIVNQEFAYMLKRQKRLETIRLGRGIRVDIQFLNHLFNRLNMNAMTARSEEQAYENKSDDDDASNNVTVVQEHLQSLSIESGLTITDEQWVDLFVSHRMSQLENLSIKSMKRIGRSSQTVAGSDSFMLIPSFHLPRLKSLHVIGGSSLILPLLDATRNTIEDLSLSCTDSMIYDCSLEFPRLSVCFLNQILPKSAYQILASSPILSSIHLNCKLAPLLNSVNSSLVLPHLRSIRLDRCDTQLTSAILSNTLQNVKVLRVAEPNQLSEEFLRSHISTIEALKVFSGNTSMFEWLSDSSVATLEDIHIVDSSSSSLLSGHGLFRKLEQCTNARIVSASVAGVVHSSTLYGLLQHQPLLSSLSLNMKLSNDLPMTLSEKHENLKYLTFDFSEMTDQLDSLLTHLPKLESLVCVTPISAASFFQTASTIEAKHNFLQHLNVIVTETEVVDESDVPMNVKLIANEKLQRSLVLNLSSTMTFREQMMLCLCAKYYCSYSEAKNSIDLHPYKVLTDDYREAESKLFYEGEALSMIEDLIVFIQCEDQTHELMLNNLKHRGLPPCIKALIELHAPAIC